MLAWHFVGEELRDGRPVPAVGEKLVHKGPVVPCRSGLHASIRVTDALKYAPGSTICRVELGGEIVEHDGDKVVASERTIIYSLDGEQLLRKFARQQALKVVHLWDCPSVVKEYLETGKEELRDAARSAAWHATESATESAADSATDSAAESAARYAAWYAARYAAWYAARSAANAAAEAAASYAARSAAEAAAWSAAEAAAEKDLVKLIEEMKGASKNV